MTSRLDVDELRTFAIDLMAEQERKYPHLYDAVHGERDSLTKDDRLVPEALEMRAAIRARSAAAGYYGAFMPEEVGGAGWTQADCVRAFETLSNMPAWPQALWLDLSVFVTGQAWGPVPALVQGDAHIRETYLNELMAGRLTSCTAITDPAAGSDPHNMRATAVREGDLYRINGVKKFVGNAPYADLIMVYARTGGEPGRHDGISMFVVERGTPGVEITRVFPVMEGRGNHGEITLTDCAVPAANLVGQEGKGFYYLMSFIDAGRLLLGSLSLGGAQWCLDRAVERLQSRSTFGVALGDRQGLRWRVAEVAAQIVALRAVVHEAADRLDAGLSARTETAVAKLMGPRVYHQAADLALQVWGGEGFIADHMIERHYRRARGMRIYMGTDEMQLETIAKAQLGS